MNHWDFHFFSPSKVNLAHSTWSKSSTVKSPEKSEFTQDLHACLDLVFGHQNSTGDDATALQQRINDRHGVHIIEHAEKIGLGTRKYHIVNIDK